jgi:phosphatidylglycerol:prolipoprotein diacylglycerol transferase
VGDVFVPYLKLYKNIAFYLCRKFTAQISFMLINLLSIVWDVDPEFISEPISIRWYGLLFAVAFFGGYKILEFVFKREGINKDWLDKVLLYVMAGTIIGARLGHVFFYDWEYYSQNPIKILMIREGGLASHGAGIGMILSLWIFSKIVSKKPLLWIMDRVVLTVALGAVFVRLGNLMNHEIIGHETSMAWGFIFTRIDDVPRHPSQLYEAFCYLITFFTLFGLYLKKGWGNKQGVLFGLFLAMLFTARFFVEFVKEIQSDFEAEMALNMGQWLSIPFVLLGLFFIFRGFFYQKSSL